MHWLRVRHHGKLYRRQSMPGEGVQHSPATVVHTSSVDTRPCRYAATMNRLW